MTVVAATDIPAELQDLPNFSATSEVYGPDEGFPAGTHYVTAHINDSFYVGYGTSDAAAFANMLADNDGIQAAIDATRANGQHDEAWFYEHSSDGGEFGGGAVYDPPATEFNPLDLDMGILALSADHLVIA